MPSSPESPEPVVNQQGGILYSNGQRLQINIFNSILLCLFVFPQSPVDMYILKVTWQSGIKPHQMGQEKNYKRCSTFSIYDEFNLWRPANQEVMDSLKNMQTINNKRDLYRARSQCLVC